MPASEVRSLPCRACGARLEVELLQEGKPPVPTEIDCPKCGKTAGTLPVDVGYAVGKVGGAAVPEPRTVYRGEGDE